jgi:hypothetical protein
MDPYVARCLTLGAPLDGTSHQGTLNPAARTRVALGYQDFPLVRCNRRLNSDRLQQVQQPGDKSRV